MTTAQYKYFATSAIKLADGLNKTKFSLLNLYPPSESSSVELYYQLSDYLENVLYVSSKIKTEVDNVQKLNPKKWEENKETMMEKTKNSFVIYNNFEGNIDELKKSFRSYYPVVYVIYKDTDIEIEAKNVGGWKMFVHDNTVLLVNKNIRDFSSLVFTPFETREISSRTSAPKKTYKQRKDEDLISLDINKESDDVFNRTSGIEPTTIQKPSNTENFDIFKNLPLPSVEVNHKSSKWRKEFYNYLHTLIGRILPPGEEKLLDYILNKQTINEVWLKVFTHKVNKPTIGENYEVFEAIGDRVLKYVFALYYHERFPLSDQGQMNDAFKHFQSDDRQAATGRAMGLMNWIDGPKETSSSLKEHEDLYEAFAGGLELVLNKYTVMGKSTKIFYNLFHTLYDDFDFGKIQIDPRTWLGQLIEGISKKSFVPRKEKSYFLPRPREIPPEVFSKIIEHGNSILEAEGFEHALSDVNTAKQKDPGFEFKTIITDSGQTEFRVVLNDYGADVLQSYGFNVKSGMLVGSATEPTSKPAERNGSEDARQNLMRLGITDEWRDEQRKKRKFSKIVNFREALIKAKSMHKDICDLDIINPVSLKRDNFFQLIGLTKTHKKYLLETLITQDKTVNNFQMVIDQFLQS